MRRQVGDRSRQSFRQHHAYVELISLFFLGMVFVVCYIPASIQ